MKKLFALLLIVCMAFGLVACGSSSQGTPASSGGEASSATEVTHWKIGFSYHNMDENITKSWNFLKAAWEEWDAAHPEYEVELVVTDAKGDVATQLADCESLIVQKCDLIQIMVVDSDGSIPAIEAIEAAGIPCVDSGYIAHTDVSTLRIMTSDPSYQGQLQGEYIDQYLQEHPDEKLYVGWFYGNPAASSTLARHDGVAAMAEKYPDRFIVLEEQYANWLTDDAMAIMETWLLNYPEMNCIMSASDDMAIGAINVLKEQGRDVEPWVILGIDGSASGFERVAAGELDGTVLMAMALTSPVAVDCEVGILKGLDKSEEYGIDLTPHSLVNLGSFGSQMVTKDNIDDMYELAGVPRP